MVSVLTAFDGSATHIIVPRPERVPVVTFATTVTTSSSKTFAASSSLSI